MIDWRVRMSKTFQRECLAMRARFSCLRKGDNMKKSFIVIMLIGAALFGWLSRFAPCAEAAGAFPDVREKVDAILDDGTEYAVFLAYPGESSETIRIRCAPRA